MDKIKKLIFDVKKIPIENIVGNYVELVPKGVHMECLCPWHLDQHLGSFKVTPSKNIWYCFTCQVGGDAIDFVQRYENISYQDAVLKIAYNSHLVGKEELKELSDTEWDDDFEYEVKEIQNQMEDKKEQIKASPEIISIVYESLKDVCRLTAAHEKHLSRVRKLRKEQMEDYFTFPDKNALDIKKIIVNAGQKASHDKFGVSFQELNYDQKLEVSKKIDIVIQNLKYVPGFYENKRTGEIEACSIKGIGFLVRNVHGQPIGIQIRRDVVKDGESRYVWFSSGFTEYSKNRNLAGGASPGAPGGVIKPRIQRKDGGTAICVTEGRFKAEKIADGGNYAVYVSGVSSWRAVLDDIEDLRSLCKTNRIFLMFDADMMGNTSVHKQLSAMQHELESRGFKTYVVLWSKRYGKGFDDLVIGRGISYMKYLTYMKYEEFDAIYQQCLSYVLNRFGIDMHALENVSKENRAKVVETLQETVENACHLK